MMLMQMQMTSCHEDVREDLKQELTKKIGDWYDSGMEVQSSVMQQVKAQLYSVLQGNPPVMVSLQNMETHDQTQQPGKEEEGEVDMEAENGDLGDGAEREVTEESASTQGILGRVVGAIMGGFRRTDQIDKDFSDDPAKMATMPELRETSYC